MRIRCDKKEGKRLQKLANAMFMRGDIGSEYNKVRKAAEKHLGFWRWQATVPAWKLVGETNPYAEIWPKACISFVFGTCPYLPAGSEDCQTNDCPSKSAGLSLG